MHHRLNARALSKSLVLASAAACAAHAQATGTFDLAPYAMGMAKAQAKAVGYDNCTSADNSNPNATVSCSATTPLKQWPTAKVTLVFDGPSTSKITRIRVATDLKLADIIAKLEPIAPPLKNGPRSLTFIDSKDTIANISTGPVGSDTVWFKKEPGAYKRQAAHEEKQRQQSAKLKNF